MPLAVSGGQTLFTLELPLFAISLVDILSLMWDISTNIRFCQKYNMVDKHMILKNHVGLKLDWAL